MLLPNSQKAFIDNTKLTDYCLNPMHPTGKDKARLFKSIFGITQENALILRSEILKAVQTELAIEQRTDSYGTRYFVDFLLSHNDNTNMVRTAWIVETKEDFPRLISCYIKI